jgi:hypothetical protein
MPLPTPPGYLTFTAKPGIFADGNIANDWSAARLLEITGGDDLNPSNMHADYYFEWQDAVIPPPGAYEIHLRGILTGLTFSILKTTGSEADPCSPTAQYSGYPTHFWPTAKTELGSNCGTCAGKGMFVENNKMVLVISDNPPGDTDLTPPSVVGTDPANNTTVVPGLYGPGKPIAVSVHEDQSPLDRNNSYLKLQRNLGTVTEFVEGVSTFDGAVGGKDGVLYFIPKNSLDTGGTYTIQITVCNIGTPGAGKCLNTTSTFVIEDKTAPQLFSAWAVTAFGVSYQVYSGTQTGLFPTPLDSLKEISVTIMIPSGNGTTNIINPDLCSLSLIRTTDNAQVPITLESKQLATDSRSLTLTYRLDQIYYQSASFRIDVSAASQNPLDQTKTYAATITNPPSFFTSNPGNLVNICQGPCGAGSTVVLSMLSYTAVTGSVGNPTAAMQSITPNAATIYGLSLNPASIPALPSGYSLLPNTAPLQFGVGAIPIYNMNFKSDATVNVTVYFDSVNIPAGLTPTSISVKGYTYKLLVNPWQDLPATFTPVMGRNLITFSYVSTGANGVTIPDVFVVVYPQSAAIASGFTPTPVPVALDFGNTRSFNPKHVDPVHRSAVFYYSYVPVADVEARVFNVGGTLIRTLTVKNNDISLVAFTTDPATGKNGYFFTWDGTNDSKDLVKNGIYLVRYRVKLLDGNVTTENKVVALIR